MVLGFGTFQLIIECTVIDDMESLLFTIFQLVSRGSLFSVSRL